MKNSMSNIPFSSIGTPDNTEYAPLQLPENIANLTEIPALKSKAVPTFLSFSDTEFPIHTIVKLGTSGDDNFDGTIDDDTLSGIEGNDTIHALEGNDTAYGGDGDDYLYGDAGADFLHGGVGGTDTIQLFDPMDPTLSWLNLTSGTYTVSGDTITLSADSSGVITLLDGTTCTFENLELIHLV